MDGEGGDPRAIDSRARLLEALLELTIERGYDKTRVRDVLERASVAKSTFYAHFENKDDLFVGSFDLFRVRPVDGVDDEGEPRLPAVDRLFSHAGTFRDLYESLAKSGDLDLPMGKVAADLVEGYRDVFEDLVRRGFRLPGEPELLARFASGAFVGVLIDWLERGTPEPAATMAERFEGLLRSALEL